MNPETLMAKAFMEKWDQFVPPERRAEFCRDVVDMHVAVMQSASDKMALALGQRPADLSSRR